MSTNQEFSPITVEKVELDNYGNTQAMLRQSVKNLLSGNNRTNSFFKTPANNEEKRVVFLQVPEGTTVADVEAKIAEHANARLYKVLSLYPILTSGQQKRIDADELNLDDIALKQAVQPQPGVFPTYKNQEGLVQYRQTYLDAEGREDEDYRDDDLASGTVYGMPKSLIAATPAVPADVAAMPIVAEPATAPATIGG